MSEGQEDGRRILGDGMSNKLVKHQEQKERLTGKQKKILFWGWLIILIIAFAAVWINIFLTSDAFNKQIEEMIPGSVYSEYNAGDSITAYTTDHISYSYYKEGILPDTEYTNNELMKAVGGLLGIGICSLILLGLLSKKINYRK